MSRIARKKQPRRPRRKDEASLYFIFERDLDRETIFSEHDGWYSQINTEKGRIDYGIRFGNLILGVEVKSGFPNRSHFQQVLDKYGDCFDALYLAYPSDRAAEAFSVRSRRSNFSEIGLISIALYRTHCFRKASAVGRESDYAWATFDDDEYWDEISEYTTKKRIEIVSSVLSDEGHIKLTERDWRSLALLYAMYKVTSVDKFHSVDDLWQKHCKDLKWNGSVSYFRLSTAGLVRDRSYGVMLSLFNLTHEGYQLRRKIEKHLKEKLGVRRWKQLVGQWRAWKKDHTKRQKEVKRENLREE